MGRLWNRFARSASKSSPNKAWQTEFGKIDPSASKPETLETRQLLAANIFHNELMPGIVNEDGCRVRTGCLGTIIQNQMNSPVAWATMCGDSMQAATNIRGLGTNDGTSITTDADTAVDALVMVIYRLNRGSQTGGGDLGDRT